MKDLKDYDHDELYDSFKACGLGEEFPNKMSGITEIIMSASKTKNLISQLTEFCESNFSKREMAFVLSKLTLNDIAKEVEKQQVI